MKSLSFFPSFLFLLISKHNDEAPSIPAETTVAFKPSDNLGAASSFA
ncbi:hypothetical protein KSW08_02280 [Catenibacterium mitsuokai]|nr:hypothetical protein [Catenibacterium mitsuokai]MBV3424817.1 hypothetical protein [Catenibacterium mitsuokai]